VPPAVTPQRAQQLFNLVNSRLCCPASAPAPCIPFLYPDDGCWGRAHEMCRLMIVDGAQPEKVWIYGRLNVNSQNKPNCLVQWNYHVAPTLQVTTANGVQTWVIDPSLFPGPVPQATWVGVQGDPNAVVESSSSAIFTRSQGGGSTQTDPTYAQTNFVLITYRDQLRLRSADPDGPPPYFACMTKPPRVHWFGGLGPNQTRKWFTAGWGAASHVLWTIMPLTPCPGRPQLTWKVQVERANATQCTYWITITNLTSDPVKFEGRYDVLS
jgi:Glutaminase